MRGSALESLLRETFHSHEHEVAGAADGLLSAARGRAAARRRRRRVRGNAA
jgi:hypothetical protein